MFRHDNHQDDQGYQGQPGQMGAVTHPSQAPQGNPADGAPASDSQTMGGYVATPAPGAPTDQPVNTDDLLDIKHDALQQLSPLVGHLEQTPEEKFRTTMMMIQASDNHALVREAYEAAQQIPSEKERAQAFLDIINEINYFTQQNQTQAQPEPDQHETESV